MRYVALLRGINAGGNRRVEMSRLKALFHDLGLEDISTYINSGNAIFSSGKSQGYLRKMIELSLLKEFGFEVQTLVKTLGDIRKIADSIPSSWKNDLVQKTDVAYLFPEIDKKDVIDDLPVRREFIDIRYAKGALLWNIRREHYNKSHINKIISHPHYKLMTVRNVNTARYLAALES